MLYLKEQSFYQRYKISPEGLVLWLDQSDGRSYGDLGNWYDMSGNGNHAVQATGANQPAIAGALGLAGSCRSFDGSDYMNCGNGASLNFLKTDTFSFSAWIRSGATGSHNGILGKYDVFVGYLFAGYEGTAAGELRLHFQLQKTGYKSRVGSTNIGDNRWHHGVITYDGSDTLAGIKLYVEGVEESYIDASSGTIGDITVAQGLLIGSADIGLLPFTGHISCIQVYNIELTAAVIQRMYLEDAPRYGGL